METESRLLRGTVCEGYRVLLRAEAELLLPVGYARIAAFYLAMAQKCMAWATEVRGEWARGAYLADGTGTGRGLRVERYRFDMCVTWEDGESACMLCRSVLQTGDGRENRKRMAQLWCLSEQTVWPLRGAAAHLGLAAELRGLSFKPEGLYVEEGRAVFFQNAVAGEAEREAVLPWRSKKT